MAGSLVIRVGVRDRVGGHRVALELAHDLLARAPPAGVDEHVADQECVDRVRHRDRVEMPDAFGYLLHDGDPNRRDRKNACR